MHYPFEMLAFDPFRRQVLRFGLSRLEPVVDDRRNCKAFRCISSDGETIEEGSGVHELQKCDAAKPVCGPCRKHPKDDECEYSDGPSRSRTKVLEETVSRLEARLYEIEHPDETTPTVTLHDPYSPYNASQRLSKSPQAPVIPFGPVSPFPAASTTPNLPSRGQWKNFATLDPMIESPGSSGSSASPIGGYASPPYLSAEEPPFSIIKNLLDNFLPHSSALGFFLDKNHFRESTLLRLPFGHPPRPSPALLSAVYLWGAHLSQSELLLAQEYTFITHMLQYTATDLLGAHPHKVLHTLQAEILIAYYFLRTGRFLEAKCHTGTAVALALGCGLNKIRSSNLHTPSAIGLVSDAPISLHPPQDNIEEGERINGFWAVLMLHKLMSVALESPANVCGTLEAPGMQIDTPWPLESSEYSDGLLHPDVRGNATVRNFLGNNTDNSHDGHSMTAMNIKASILFHRAAHLSGQWTPNLLPRELHIFSATFRAINELIESFRGTLPPMSQLGPGHSSTEAVLLTHALADAATIKLHSVFSYADLASKQHCLNAAQNLVTFGGLELQDLGYINPLMGTLWMIACHVFIDEISRVRSLHDTWLPGASNLAEELMDKLKRGITALSLFSEDNALIKYQLTKVQEAFSAI